VSLHWDNDVPLVGTPDSEERFSRRGQRRKPPRSRSVAALLSENQEHYNPATDGKFTDPSLNELHKIGLLIEIESQLKSGKEATVYLGRGPDGLLAVKLYIDSRVRSFKDDAIYRQSRFISDGRMKKAIDQRSEYGISAQNILWVGEEFSQLHALYNAGVPVPQPLALAGNVILMELIGDEDAVAPRLSDAKLTPVEVASAWQQATECYARILSTGRVHGDYSTFNLLWWQGRVVVIDFPQVVLVTQNPAAAEILKRDIIGLCRTFSHFGLRHNPEQVLQDIKIRARSYASDKLGEEMEKIL
jgi:RIO kinase 1